MFIRYTPEDLLLLKESPLVVEPSGLPPRETYMGYKLFTWEIRALLTFPVPPMNKLAATSMLATMTEEKILTPLQRLITTVVHSLIVTCREITQLVCLLGHNLYSLLTDFRSRRYYSGATENRIHVCQR